MVQCTKLSDALKTAKCYLIFLQDCHNSAVRVSVKEQWNRDHNEEEVYLDLSGVDPVGGEANLFYHEAAEQLVGEPLNTWFLKGYSRVRALMTVPNGAQTLIRHRC